MASKAEKVKSPVKKFDWKEYKIDQSLRSIIRMVLNFPNMTERN